MQSCFNAKNQTGNENDLCGMGEIKRWEGLIPEKQTLYCRECSTIIPNCMACTKTNDCDMCKSGYRRAQIKDAYGIDRVVCVKNFCGFYGEGSGCTGKVKIEGCDQSYFTLYNKKLQETCQRCSAGYILWQSEADK